MEVVKDVLLKTVKQGLEVVMIDVSYTVQVKND
jgi:hypothetical protein